MYVVGVSLLSVAGAELVFDLPLELNENLPELLSKLDESSNTLQIRSYGLAVSSMEQVVLHKL